MTHNVTNDAPNGVPVERIFIAGHPYLSPQTLHNHSPMTAISDGGQGTFPPGTTWFYPGLRSYPENYNVIRFTVPDGADGTYDLTTGVRPAYDGFIQGDTDFHLLMNGVVLFERQLAPGTSAGYTNSLVLSAGDTIDFALGRGADDSHLGSGLKIDATLDLASTDPVAPTIVLEPRSQTVTEGANVTFSVMVSGSSPLSYQWSHNGTTIDGATAASLILNWVQLGQAGDYALSVSNAYGKATSDTAVLTVNPALPHADLSRDFSLVSNPNGVWSYGWKETLGGAFGLMTYKWTNSPNDGVPVARIATHLFSLPQTLHNHSSTTAISDGGQGTFPPGTTWFYPGVQSNPENYNVIRFTVPHGRDGTYDLATSVRPAYDGSIQGDTDFHVLINGVVLFERQLPPGASVGYTNSLVLSAGDAIDFALGRGADDSHQGSGLKIEATLDLTSTNPVAPTIILQPQSQTVSEWTNVTLSVGVRGTSPLSYQWSRNGTAIDGATATSLILNRVHLGQAGDYVVSVSNAYGMATSGTASLTVIPPPDYDLSRDFSLDSNPNGVWSYGSEGTLGGAFDLMTYKWTNSPNDGVPVARIATHLFSLPQTLHNHSSTTAISDGGQGTFPPGTTWFYPGVQSNLENYNVIRFTVPHGRDGTYDLATSVRPAYDGSIQGDTDFHVLINGMVAFEHQLAPGASVGYTNSLALSAGDTIDFALGRGADHSEDGSALKIDATLDLASTDPVPPTIILQPRSHTVIEGANVTFSVVVSSSSRLSYQWSRNGTAIDGATGASLTLNNVQLGQAGDYVVSVSNAVGTATGDTAILTVNAAPPPADYDLSRDFSLASNPNGVWSYGWQSSLGFAAPPLMLLAHTRTNISGNGVPLYVRAISPFDVPAIVHNASSDTATDIQGTYPPGTTWFHPGAPPYSFCVIRFTVPNGADGPYDLATTVRPVWDGSIQAATVFRILRNGLELFGRVLPAGASTGYSNEVLLAVGDTIDFVTSQGSFHGSGLKIEATLDLTSTNPVPPTIVSQPQNRTVTEEANVVFSVGVSGSSPLSYQWLRNGTAVDGATADSLTLNNVHLGQAGDYAVSVSNTYGMATSGTAVLTVNPRLPESDYDLSRDFSPVSNPSGAWSYGYTAELGADFNLSTTARTDYSTEGVPFDVWAKSSTQAPAVLHNGTSQIGTGGGGVYPPGVVCFAPGPSSGESSLGVIRFTVPNGGDGSYEIRTAVGPVFIAQRDTDFHVLRNGVQLYGVDLPGGNLTASYSNTLALVGGETIDFVIGRGVDNSLYNSMLRIEAFIDLLPTNAIPPTVVSQPQSQTVDLGTTVSLEVGVYGSVPVTYQWQFNGTDIPDETNSTLVLEFGQPADTGDYRVLVSNAYGNATSAVARVTVHAGVAATISSQPTGGQFLTGATVTLSATTLGTAPLNHQWYYNGLLLTGAVSSSLVIEDIQTSQSGTYWVVVTNQFASATSRGVVVSVWDSMAGGKVLFANKTNSLIYDVDGETPLPPGMEYLAQLYAGPDASSLQPVGAAVGFSLPGRFFSGTRIITSVPAGGTATVQVRAWRTAYGTTYEQALAEGGKTGASPIFTVVTAGNPFSVPTDLTGLQRFSLVPGARAATPEIGAAGRSSSGTFTFSFAGSRNYVVEASTNLLDWTVLTNVVNATGSVQIADPASQLPQRFYRTRITE